jgi:hypothetical protein
VTLSPTVAPIPATIPVPPAGQTLSQAVDATSGGAVVPASAQESIEEKPEVPGAADVPAGEEQIEANINGQSAKSVATAKSTAQAKAPERPFIPRDPFDPEIFNRRHRAKLSTSAAVRQP